MQRPWEILVNGAHQCSAASLSRKAPDRWRDKKCLVMAFADARSENRRMNDDKRMIQFVYPRLSKHLKKCPQKIASMHIQGVLKIIGVWLFGRRVFENGAFEHWFPGRIPLLHAACAVRIACWDSHWIGWTSPLFWMNFLTTSHQPQPT